MNAFLCSDEFDAWLSCLKDSVGRARIVHRIRAAEHGNFDDCQLLLGGNKSSQRRDIKRAIELARALNKE